MPNSYQLREQVGRMLKARIPFISINSLERSRVLKVLNAIADELGTQFYLHGLSKGTTDLKTKRGVNEDRTIVGGLDFALQQINQRQNITYIFTEISELDDDTPLARHFYDSVNQAIDNGGTIIVITTKPVWPQLQRLGMAIKLDTPDEDEMYEIVRSCIVQYIGHFPIEWDEADYKQAATILCNMTEVEAENVIATLLAKHSLTKDDLDELSMAKDQLFSDISGLEKVKIQPDTLAVAGLSGLQQWLGKQKALLTIDLKDRHIRPPRGVLLVGVPGCGKSLSAKYIAASWNLPLYRLDLASIQGQYLGQSENRLKEALESADKAAPCVLWIDEIEKGLSGAASGDGGTSTRMVGQFLFWLQESKYRSFVVATANDVSKLPPELLRKGRFDELFFVDLPGEDERRDIIQLYVTKTMVVPPSDECFEQLIGLSEGFAGADIEASVREIAIHSVLNGQHSVDDSVYIAVFENTVPLSKTSPEQIEAIRAWGKERAVLASGLSWKDLKGVEHSGRRSILL